jgi:hypothetical protein
LIELLKITFRPEDALIEDISNLLIPTFNDDNLKVKRNNTKIAPKPRK